MSTNYQDLREFIARLDREGELLRISGEVSSELEITEFTDRMSKSPRGGRALLFENVKGSRFPVLTNAFGSEVRMAMALGTRNLEDLGKRISDLLDMRPPTTLREKLGLLPELLTLSKCFPKVRKMARPPCQDVVLEGDDVDLGLLPVLRCWPRDGGRFVTLPVVFTKSLGEGKRNVGMYRMQVYDRNTTGMHWHIHKDGSHYFNDYRKAGKRMELAVAIGTDPAVTYAATAPMPQGMDEMLLAGFIRGAAVELVKCRTVDLEVPATAEFVLEGYVDPEEMRTEGPFGDHTGYYSLQGEYPVFHITALTHRKDAIYSATVVGRPPMEDCYMAKATERIFLPPLRKVVPEIVDHWMPWEGVFHNIVVTAIEKEYPMQARRVMNALWGNGQMSFAKMIVVVDDAALLADPARLLQRIQDNIDPWSDLILTEGVLDVLDHSAPNPLYGGKLGIDATERVRGEPPRERGKFLCSLSEDELLGAMERLDPGFVSCRMVAPRSTNPLVLVGLKKEHRSSRYFMDKLGTAEGLTEQGIIVLYDDIDLSDGPLVLWKAFNNIDPLRDIRLSDHGLLVDATRKGTVDGYLREWPDEIEMSEEIKEKVRRRKGELGLEGPL
jgi:4-hydroxy-3-polyprenylbenzoate decarboxylase